MKILRQSTASTLLLGPFIDDTDGKTAETGLTLAQADIQLWKEGGTTLGQKNDASSCTVRTLGYYTCPINSTDTNTLGMLTVAVHQAGSLPVKDVYRVVPAEVYDALVNGTGVGVRADQRAWLGTTVPAADTAGYPKVTIKDGTGTGELDTNAGQIALTTAGVNAVRDALLAAVVDSQGSISLQMAIKGAFNTLCGVTTIAGATYTIKTPDGVSTRVTFTLDANKQRTAVALSL